MYILTCRFSMFGNFSRFTPTTSNIIEWTQMFQHAGYEFLPTIINPPVPPIPFLPIQVGPQDKRVQFTSSDNKFAVRVLAERVDVESTLIETDDPSSTLGVKYNELKLLIETMLGALAEEKGTRMAFYIDAMLPEKKAGQFNSIYANNNLNLVVRNSESCVEWAHRFNHHLKINVGSYEELCNAIFSLESAIMNATNNNTGEQFELKGVHITSDINTLAENSDARFESENLAVFCSEAKDLFINVYNQITDIFK